MSKKQIAEFICKATDFNNCSENDERVRSFLREFDLNNDGFVELEDFLGFYLNSSVSKKGTVYDNLKSLGYGKDLKLKNSGITEGPLECSHTIRYKLITNNDNCLWDLLQDLEELRMYCLRLLKTLKKNVLSFGIEMKLKHSIKSYINWNDALKTFLYTMPPSLDIIEQIIFNERNSLQNIHNNGEIGYYKMVIFFAILFKPDQMMNLLKVLSGNKSLPHLTSNDNFVNGKVFLKLLFFSNLYISIYLFILKYRER